VPTVVGLLGVPWVRIPPPPPHTPAAGRPIDSFPPPQLPFGHSRRHSRQEALIKRLLIGLPFFLGATIAFVALIASQAGAPPSGEAGPTCANSFAAFGPSAGHWDGSWDDGFGGGGPLSMDLTLNSDCTLQAKFDGIFGQPDGLTVDATYRDDNGSSVVDIVGDPVFGDTTITITGAGSLTLTGTDLHQGIDLVTATGTVTPTHISLEITLNGFTETAELTREVAATATPTDTPTPTDAPTPTSPGPTPIAWARLWGDLDCNNLINPIDSLKVLRGDAGLGVTYLATDCPQFGAAIPASVPATPWGDIDCSGQVNPVDSLKTLRHDAGLSVGQADVCPEIGSPF